MKKLYAPWRNLYKRLITKDAKNSYECPFCAILKSHDDSENFVIKRYTNILILLNMYPYNAGHLLVIPNTHCSSLNSLDPKIQTELIHITSLCTTVLQQELGCQGFNIGINIGGPAAGGSIPEHLHMHVLPRFNADTNFLVTLADTKLISIDLKTLYKKIASAFSAL